MSETAISMLPKHSSSQEHWLQKPVPLASFSLLKPFFAALRTTGVDPERPLSLAGLAGGPALHTDGLVHITCINRFLEACAEVTGDPTFCSGVGCHLDPNAGR